MHVALLVTEISRQDQNFRIIPRKAVQGCQFTELANVMVSLKASFQTTMMKYSKTCVKWPLKIRQNKGLNDKRYLIESQK